jgi:hypothetical protein
MYQTRRSGASNIGYSLSTEPGGFPIPARQQEQRATAVTQTNNKEYRAGETVQIRGSGFLPFDSVCCRWAHQWNRRSGHGGHAAWYVQADATGSIATSWSIDLNDNSVSLLGRLVLRATRSRSLCVLRVLLRSTVLSAREFSGKALCQRTRHRPS